jgi:hypothetical protein
MYIFDQAKLSSYYFSRKSLKDDELGAFEALLTAY